MNKTIPYSLFSDFDLNLFKSGFHTQLHDKFGSHPTVVDGVSGTYFAVFAPGAKSVNVIGSFNYWNGADHSLFVQWNGSGIWEGFIPGVGEGELYKYRIISHHDDKIREKADPYARENEMPPKSASIISKSKYKWRDTDWMSQHRSKVNNLNAPMSVYECHLGSWQKKSGGSESLSYKELATTLVDYLEMMNYTHVEFLPVMEHPFYPSWGYLCTGYFSPTRRYGTPDEFKYLVDKLHEKNIGVILDWVPAHFPNDEHALADFDGTCLYEHPDRQKGFHPDWNSLIFNFERAEIRSFLLSSAHYWLGEYHADGLRVDAVASMLYLDYSRKEGEWTPNEHGSNHYLAAIDFLKELNISAYREYPDIQMIAEESTAFDGVTRPVDLGGLGFGLKWMMGWMNDSLEYFSKDPIHRKYHHGDISRSLTYAFSENYLLPLSHDEVVHGKGSILAKMPGDEWQRFANLRLLYSYMYTHPGQKLLFMGDDIGQSAEWNVDLPVDWQLLDYEPHSGVQACIRDLNSLYRNIPALYELNYEPAGFEWISYDDADNCVLAYIRKGRNSEVIILANFTPRVLHHYNVGVPHDGNYMIVYNSDEKQYWGSGVEIAKENQAMEQSVHNHPFALDLTLPPLALIILEKTH